MLFANVYSHVTLTKKPIRWINTVSVSQGLEEKERKKKQGSKILKGSRDLGTEEHILNLV